MRSIGFLNRGNPRKPGIEKTALLSGTAQHQAALANRRQVIALGIDVVGLLPQFRTPSTIEIERPVVVGPLQALRDPYPAAGSGAVDHLLHPTAHVVFEPCVRSHSIVAEV